MISFVSGLWDKLKSLVFPSDIARFTIGMSDVAPSHETIRSGKITIVGSHDFHKWAYLRCPCGCNSLVTLSLSQTRRPSWRVTIDDRGAPTIHPSIRETDGCYSHYWIKMGEVIWCKDTGYS